MQAYDCIVVGAGPAGAAAGRHLARKGLSVLLLEKAVLPRYKTCGGAISGLAARELDFDFGSVVEAELQEVDVRLRLGRPLRCRSEAPYARFVMRDRFDHLLTTKAVEAGCRLRDGCPVEGVEVDDGGVRVRTGGGSYRGRALIGADGATGVVAGSVGLAAPRSGAALEAEVEAPPEHLERFRRRALVSYGEPPWGYAWVFPKARHLSVGIGTLKAPAPGLRKALGRFLERLGLAGAPLRCSGHPIPSLGPSRRLQAGPVLLAGDAAGLCDPLSGEGIAHALISGRLAAEEVAAGLASGRLAAGRYEARVAETIGAELRIAQWIARRLYTFPRLFFWLFEHSRPTLEFYFHIVRGERTYRELGDHLKEQFLRFGLFRGQQEAGDPPAGGF